jgi:PAS domain S-box-containing protein
MGPSLEMRTNASVAASTSSGLSSGKFERLVHIAWIPIPTFLCLIGILWFVKSPASVNLPVLRLILNFSFGVAIPVWLVVLAGQQFRQSRAPPILLLGCGTLLLVSANFISSIAFHYDWVNGALTVSTLGTVVAGAIHVSGAGAIGFRGGRSISRPVLLLKATYGAALGLALIFAYLAWMEALPPFYTEQEGVTPLRRSLQLSAVVLFGIAAVSIASISHERNWTFGRWYGLALGLISIGFLALALSRQPEGLLSWTGRGAQYLGGVYLLTALLTCKHEDGPWNALAYSALFESEKRYRVLAQATSEGICLIRDGLLTDANEQLGKMIGCPPADLAGRRLESFLPPEAALALSRVLLSQKEVTMEHPLRSEDGRSMTVETNGRTFRLHGRTVRLLAIREISARKETEEALRRALMANESNLAQLSAIFDHMNEGLTIFSPGGELLRMNPAGMRVHHLGESKLLHRDPAGLAEVFQLCDLAGKEISLEEWPASRALRGEVFLSQILRVRKRDQDQGWIGAFGGAPVRDRHGQLLCALVTFRDVTREIEAEIELKRSRDELELRVRERTIELQNRADQLARLTSELTLAEERERGRLAAILHDHLQQILVAARFGLRAVSVRVAEDVQQKLSEIEGLLNESLDVSRSLTTELSPPILHEAGLAAGLAWLARQMEQKHGLVVALDADPELRVAREDVRFLLFQAIRELLLNIVKHAQTDHASVKLLRTTHAELEAVIEDEGIGFDPAEALHRRTEQAGGFGLFSIRERIDLLGGVFEVESAPGKGARFRLTLSHFD